MMRLACLILMLAWFPAAGADVQYPALIVAQESEGVQSYSVTVQLLLLMTSLVLLPTALIMLTPFTRIIIVLAILRQGIGTSQTPNNQILIGLALFLTLFIISPLIGTINADAVQPYLAGDIGLPEAASEVRGPLHQFLLGQTRSADLGLFAELAAVDVEAGPEAMPMHVVVPAFITSELKTAFLIGFLLLLPFLIIDLVVASVLMSMGMVMLSPLIISLPFKLMLFVLVDGWSLILGTLASSYILGLP